MPASYEIDAADVFLDVCGGDYRKGYDKLGFGACVGYVAGLTDGEKGQTHPAFCVPETVEAVDLVPLIGAHILEHPSRRYRTTRQSVSEFLGRAYPCSGSTAHEGTD